VVIQRSSSAQTTQLVQDLLGDDAVRRETAIARLAIVGERAVDRLLSALPQTSSAGQVAVLRALELIGTPRALPAAVLLLQATDDAVAAAAAGTLRPHVRSAEDTLATRALEALTVLALDTRRPDVPRLAALDALGETNSDTLQPIRERLRRDASAGVRRMAGWSDANPAENAAARLETAAKGDLPEDGDVVRGWLSDAGGIVALSALQDLVVALRERERSAGHDAIARLRWMTARAAAHQALAERHSRLAVFDLRETLDTATARLPLGFLAAVTQVGDASCLEPLAAAWHKISDPWMREQLAAAFREILAREHLTRRHAVIRRIIGRFPDAAQAMLVS
jgi:HEAT repeat protein